MATPNLLNIGTVAPGILASAQMAAGANTVYTVPADHAALIRGVTLCNVSAAGVVVTVSVLRSGDAVDGTHEAVHSYTLAPSDSLDVIYAKGWLGQGDSIRVNAAVATAIDVKVDGLVFS